MKTMKVKKMKYLSAYTRINIARLAVVEKYAGVKEEDMGIEYHPDPFNKVRDNNGNFYLNSPSLSSDSLEKSLNESDAGLLGKPTSYMGYKGRIPIVDLEPILEEDQPFNHVYRNPAMKYDDDNTSLEVFLNKFDNMID